MAVPSGPFEGQSPSEILIDVIQELARVPKLPQIESLVPAAARQLTGAAAATLIMREGDDLRLRRRGLRRPAAQGHAAPGGSDIAGWAMRDRASSDRGRAHRPRSITRPTPPPSSAASPSSRSAPASRSARSAATGRQPRADRDRALAAALARGRDLGRAREPSPEPPAARRRADPDQQPPRLLRARQLLLQPGGRRRRRVRRRRDRRRPAPAHQSTTTARMPARRSFATSPRPCARWPATAM